MHKFEIIGNQKSTISDDVEEKFLKSGERFNFLGKNHSHKKEKRNLAWKVAPDLFASFKYAWGGIVYAFATQRNFRIHTVMASVAITLGFYLHATTVEMAIISLTCATVMVLELLNTAIESVVDLTVKQTYHELAKIAKDCAAGAVLVSAIAAILVAGFILLPHAIDLIISF
ncbi:MAG: diacylglycerol kinase family protein [Cyanobacteria bacterium]|nr:diacylglycerol kinase family protein [Cyanobacteria bacterium CG_2015-16_32_12]NCO78596.1 diacylglycerol kinase family protein [Cyanobacteria bacterium CG_2015-22_32_23]NCQ02988.1 diacylglycerol kinase family protein [Cyanobacteria bacterium CG_2015-09_32_10]NCQ40393.1 diacylglycerol kinase family protein [Cyanobacteria bacterium CG_2015-04_32_10]NCS83679.1 diacylglycerol kinase family protein [Cyanobacteria bacterium CG_2015-02_32_10]